MHIAYIFTHTFTRRFLGEASALVRLPRYPDSLGCLSRLSWLILQFSCLALSLLLGTCVLPVHTCPLPWPLFCNPAGVTAEGGQ